ncbi:MAG TPA: hypothetical protein PLV92_25105, partial [Pirellulaceae bacterium]|nr:hypothetical protein [Pirellulaceae bacterium]
KLRQFARATDCYEAAVRESERSGGADGVGTDEFVCRALYRSAVLDEAAGAFERAAMRLRKLVQIAPEYRDAARRLDKIESMRHKSGSAPQREQVRGGGEA